VIQSQLTEHMIACVEITDTFVQYLLRVSLLLVVLDPIILYSHIVRYGTILYSLRVGYYTIIYSQGRVLSYVVFEYKKRK